MKFQLLFGLAFICTLHSTEISAQTTMEVEGSIKLGNNNDANPQPGTMRWTGIDLELWNGVTWISLTGNKDVGSLTDIHGNTYKSIRIGDQIWMAENLKVSKFKNGDPIDEVTDPVIWDGLDIIEAPGWCWYLNLSSLDGQYGKLYNKYATIDPRGLCPAGWSVPTWEDFQILKDELGGNNVAGGKMKVIGNNGWYLPNVDASNESGFTGLGGGQRDHDGNFLDIGEIGAWWSRTEDPESDDRSHKLYNHSGSVFTNDHRDYGQSVRCIKD